MVLTLRVVAAVVTVVVGRLVNETFLSLAVDDLAALTRSNSEVTDSGAGGDDGEGAGVQSPNTMLLSRSFLPAEGVVMKTRGARVLENLGAG